ncbi:MAG: exo-alpha-sialidase [Chloroflexi bacterium]|nr:MAG: exo-alpha-sialidase [Chloroflexota bacterium]
MVTMKYVHVARVIGILVVLGLMVTVASAQGPIQLPKKPKPNVLQWRSGIVEEAVFFTPREHFRPGAKQSPGHNILVNQDFNFRPQNETSIAIDPNNPKHIVTGYNDYRAGWPIGGGFSTSFDGGKTWHDGLVTFPALVTVEGIVEPPVGTGDPAVVIDNYGNAYHSSLAFSATWCENGVFVYASQDGGVSWWRPVVATGRGVVDYWSSAVDCSVFLDKEYMTVDNTGGPHDGRLYVTYTRFLFDSDGNYLESPIYLAYSDDGGATWTVVGEINGSSQDLCEFQADTTGGTGPGATGPDATPYDCDENQFSYPVVGSDGTLYVHFFNEQNESEWDPTGDFDDQILVVRVDPDTFAVDGPYQVTMVADGLSNYPISPSVERQTVCNGGWRLNAAGNIAVGPSDELYVIWSDNRNGDTFPFPTELNPDGTCPGGLNTSTDVFISKSVDGGVTWSAPQRISNDPPNFDNWFPWVAVGDNGWVWAVYYDRRVSGDNTLTDAWVAVSKDGGATWKEFRASEESSNFRNAFFGTERFIGDYNGIAVSGKKAYPIWTDSRMDGDSDVFLDIVQAGGK